VIRMAATGASIDAPTDEAQVSSTLKEVFVELLDLDSSIWPNTDAEHDHEAGELIAVDEDDLLLNAANNPQQRARSAQLL
jgi:hypothetical protein